MAFWNRRRSIDAMLAPHSGPGLKKTLGWPHLMALGVGAIVGTGILTLIGVGAGLAGPAVLISFALAGLVCACAALAYAELSTIMPASGSAYTYSYAALGEIFAWVVGCSLILEYSLVVSTVAVGWSGYAVPFLAGLGVDLPFALTVGPHVEGGLINLPAIFIIAIVTGLLPNRLAKISKRGVPAVVTVFTAIVVAFLAGIMRLDELASLANAGTLMAFMAVGVSLIVLRVRDPNRERKFKAPLWPLVGSIAIIGCIVFFFSLKSSTQIYFLLWNLFGLAVYLVWSSRNSRLAKGEEAPDGTGRG